MVDRQRAVPLQFPLVIYLAALLKCSCCWHWLSNQAVKFHPEYQCIRHFKILVYHLFLGNNPKEINLTNLTFAVHKSRILSAKRIKAKRRSCG